VSTTTATPTEPIGVQQQRVHDGLKRYIKPGTIVELRALGVQEGKYKPFIESGFFDYDHLELMAACAVRLTRKSKGVYFTLNPVKPSLHARCCNRTKRAGDGELTSDDDILHRNYLLIDADPIRDAHISATGEEKAEARHVIEDVRNHLFADGWPAPTLADSGNGFHLIYGIDLPAKDGGLVEKVLKALAQKFNNDRVKIDTAVHNPARICKIPGTWARKGDSTPERPHRMSMLLEVPDEW
jgi:hypothetical protein